MTSNLSRIAARGATAAVLSGITLLGLTGPAFAAAPAPAAPHLLTTATLVDQQAMQAIMSKHNQARGEVGVAALTWDDGLAADAQAWADHLASQGGKLVHDSNRGNAGENLASSSDATGSPADGVDLWYAEKPLYDAAPNKSTFDDSNPDWKKWGHYTQMVWSTTSQIGCGTATGAFGRVTDCRYRAPGNIQGQLAYPGGGTPKPSTGVDPADCAYNPGGRGGYGSYVDGLALDLRDWETELSTSINAYRTSHGVPALTYSRTLARPAMWASLDDYNRGRGPNDAAANTDSRGMDVATRVNHCSGYTGTLYELTYESHDVATSTWQSALDRWVRSSGDILLDPSYTTFSGAQMAYGNNDQERNPAYYTLLLGDH
jgi:uncharacterized protein YkwD